MNTKITKKITLLFLLLFTTALSQAQLVIPTFGSAQTIDFTGFTGSGFAPLPAAGQLSSDTWSVRGFSEGSIYFGGTSLTTGDFARGASAGGVTTGGLYAFDSGGSNPNLGLQPGGTDVTPGSIYLRIQNTTGSPINQLNVSYDIWEFNDQGRSNSLNFSYSTDTLTFTAVTALDFATVELADPLPAWVNATKTTVINGINIPNNGYFFLIWNTNDVSGSGSRDEIGLDNIVVTAPVPPPVTANFSATNVCSGSTTVFTDLSYTFGGSTITSWAWDFGDGSPIDNTQNPTHTYASANTYNVILVVVDDMLNTATVTIPVTVYPIPTASFTSNVSTGCNPETIFFNDASTVSTGSITGWSWDFGDGSPLSTVQNPSHTFNTPGPFVVYLTVTSDNGCTATDVLTVLIYESPVTDFSFITTGLAADFTGVVTGGTTPYTYNWYFGDGVGTSTVINPSYTYTMDGVYDVCFLAYSNDGCYDSICKTVTIITTSAKAPTLETTLTVYPNPTENGFLTLGFGKAPSSVSVAVTNVIGAVVWRKEFQEPITSKLLLNLSDQPPGNYFVNIITDKETITKRITINR